MTLRKLILLSFLTFVWLLTTAQTNIDSVYSIDPRIQVHDLTPYAEIYIDSTQTEHPNEVQDIEFQSLDSFTSSLKPNQQYWLRLGIVSDTPVEDWWLIIKTSYEDYAYYSRWEHLDAYALDPNGVVIDHQKSGVHTPQSAKKLKQPPGFVGVNVSLSANEIRYIYLRLAHEFGEEDIPAPQIELRNPSLELPANAKAELFYTLSSIAFVLCILSFFFFLFIQEKAYLFFFLYLVCLSLHYLILHPFLPFTKWFIPEHPQWTSQFFLLFTIGGFILFILFGRYFINLPALSKKTDRFVVGFLLLWSVAVVFELAMMTLFNERVLQQAITMPLIVVVGIIVRLAFFKNILARFFVVGAAWLIVFTILGLLRNGPLEGLNFNPWPIGQIGQLLIYMAGLAYKIRLNERAKAEAEQIKGMDEIKSRFFANISHEFRTPLTLIRGLLQQIGDQSTKTDVTIQVPTRHIQVMRRNTDRLLDLVNQLLDLSRLDSGKMKLQIIKGDVLQVLRALSHAFDSMAERKQIHYQIHFSEHTRIAFFDADKLEKIFTNLLSNAFKYTPEKGTVSVSIETQDQRLRISIEDSGTGIPKKELDKVFDRFYQIEGTEDKGSGIGLALVKELVDLYKGQITVSSDPGKGSQFRVSLPMDKKDFQESDMVYGEWTGQESQSIIALDEGISDWNHEHVSTGFPLLLVVEDNPDLRQFITEAVQSQYQVIEAINGQEGLEKAIQEIPDLIISDVMMPKMDGFTMTSKIKKDEKTSHIPVILLTAKADQPHKLEGLKTGADDYLTKPFDVPELLIRIENLITQRKKLRKTFAGQIQFKPAEIAVTSLDERFLTNVMEAIETNMSAEEFGVEEMAKAVAMSRSQLHRKLVALIDKSPSELLRQTRLLRAKELLLKKAGSASEVAYKVGFSSHTYFSKCYKEEFGVSPSEVG